MLKLGETPSRHDCPKGHTFHSAWVRVSVLTGIELAASLRALARVDRWVFRVDGTHRPGRSCCRARRVFSQISALVVLLIYDIISTIISTGFLAWIINGMSSVFTSLPTIWCGRPSVVRRDWL